MRSQNSTYQTWKSLWYFRHWSIVVWFLSLWKDSNGDRWQQQLKTSLSLLWCAAGLCPRPCFNYLVHKATFKLDRMSFRLQSIFCWWHSTSWFLPSGLFGRHCPTHEENCISEVKLWMDCNKLKLSGEKTESLIIKSDRIMLPDSAPTSIWVGNLDIPFATHARNLGIIISSDTIMDKHVTDVCRSVDAELRRISSIRHLLTVNAAKTLLCHFVLSKLDFCNFLLSGLPQYILDKLQRVQILQQD